MSKTAIILCSYNMPEYADALVEHIGKYVKFPYDLIFVDNGSDIVKPSKHTTIFLEKNIQMIPGFTVGFRQAFKNEKKTGKKYNAYWMMTTSCRFDPNDERDPLAMMLDVFEQDEKAFSIQPSMILDFGAWEELLAPQPEGLPRRIYALESICPLFNSKYFTMEEYWREELTFGWGLGEIYWKARKNGLHHYTHDGIVMYKDTWIGYRKDRMNMSAEERCQLAGDECDKVLIPIYGENYRDRFMSEYLEPGVWTHKDVW
jgi:hypothetical protein